MFNLFRKANPFEFSSENVKTVSDMYAKAISEICQSFLCLLELDSNNIELLQKSFGFILFELFHVFDLPSDFVTHVIQSIQSNMNRNKIKRNDIDMFFQASDIYYRSIVTEFNSKNHNIVESVRPVFFAFQSDAIESMDETIRLKSAIDCAYKSFRDVDSNIQTLLNQ